jgi:hypothetical protein
VHNHGLKEWEWVRHEWPASDDLKTALEQAADADPQAERGTYQTFTSRQNPSRESAMMVKDPPLALEHSQPCPAPTTFPSTSHTCDRPA